MRDLLLIYTAQVGVQMMMVKKSMDRECWQSELLKTVQNMAETELDLFLSGHRATADIPVIHVLVTDIQIQFIQFRFRQRHKMGIDHGMWNPVRLLWRQLIARGRVLKEKYTQQIYIINVQMHILGHQHQHHSVRELQRLLWRQIIS